MRPADRVPGLVLALIPLALIAAPARALATGDVDGLYHRLDGDLVLSLEGSVGALSVSDGVRPVVAGALRARYLDSGGIVLGYDNGPGGARYDALWLGVDVRPIMLIRTAFDLERGPRWVDLMVDSIGIDLGVAWMRPGQDLQSGSGAAFVLGTGVEFPLTWGSRSAVMLRVAGRWFASQPWDAEGPGSQLGGGNSTGLELTAGLVLRTIVRGGLVGEH